MRIRLHATSAAFATRQDGNSLIETAIVLPVLLLLLAGAVDIGRAFRAAMIVNAAAQMGAAYGIRNPTDTSGMVTAANVDKPTFVTVTSTATSGCECSDATGGTSACTATPSCSMNSVYFIQLNTKATYTPLLPWPGLPKTIPLTAKVGLRASR